MSIRRCSGPGRLPDAGKPRCPFRGVAAARPGHDGVATFFDGVGSVDKFLGGDGAALAEVVEDVKAFKKDNLKWLETIKTGLEYTQKGANVLADKLGKVPEQCSDDNATNQAVLAALKGLQTSISTTFALIESIRVQVMTIDAMSLSIASDVDYLSVTAGAQVDVAQMSAVASSYIASNAITSSNASVRKNTIVGMCRAATRLVRSSLHDAYGVGQSLQTTAGMAGARPEIYVPQSPFAAAGTEATRFGFGWSLWDVSATSGVVTSTWPLFDALDARAAEFWNGIVCESATAYDVPDTRFVVRKTLEGCELDRFLISGFAEIEIGLADLVQAGRDHASPHVRGIHRVDIGEQPGNGTMPRDLSSPVLLGVTYQAFDDQVAATQPVLGCSECSNVMQLPLYVVNDVQAMVPRTSCSAQSGAWTEVVAETRPNELKKVRACLKPVRTNPQVIEAKPAPAQDALPLVADTVTSCDTEWHSQLRRRRASDGSDAELLRALPIGRTAADRHIQGPCPTDVGHHRGGKRGCRNPLRVSGAPPVGGTQVDLRTGSSRSVLSTT